MRRFIYIFFYSFLPLFVGAEDLVVRLPTTTLESQTIYLARLRPCETSYEMSIYDTIQTDFSRDGRSTLLPIEESMQFLAFQKDETEAFQSQKWRTRGVQFVIVPKIEEGMLCVKLFDVNQATLKTMDPVKLNKNLNLDARNLHKLSDALHLQIYKTEGIASKRILYSYQQQPEPSEDGVWNAEIWEMTSDGKGQRQITQENHYSISPAFLGDPTHKDQYEFVYVTYKQGQPRIYFTNRDQPRGKPLIPLRGNQLLPDISLQRDRIAFISDASGRADLFVQSFHPARGAIGKPTQIYSFPSSVQACPSFSPDGNKLAFVSDKSGTPRVYIVDLVEVINHRKIPEIKLISKKNTDNTAPCWSPDGTKIAYSSLTNGVRQIWIYDTESEKEWQLTSGMGNKENPKWASNSLHLVYNTTSPTYDIFILNLNQCEPTRLTQGPGRKHYPAFEP